ncbi:MAG: sulfatase, partial [Methyloceanibacter sp.]
FTPLIYRGGKAEATEGGVRVDAFVRWPGMVEADSIVGDIVQVSDLFTTLARFAGATDGIPRDRVIDGVDQSALMLEGETHGRRDTVMIYSGNSLKAVVKEQYKLFVPGAGENPIGAKFYDLFRDTREEWPVSTEIGAWGGQEFVRVIQRHKKRKEKYPDEGPALGRPYEGIENLRPESVAAVEAFLMKQAAPLQ